MSSTMREQKPSLMWLALWGAVTVFAAAAGPYGTFDGLGFPARLGYWAVIVGASILLTLAQKHLMRGRSETWRRLSQLPYAAIVAGLVHGMNLVIFPHWGGWQDLGFLFAVTLSVVILIELAVFLFRRISVPSQVEVETEVEEITPQARAEGGGFEHRFLQRLPEEKRGPLIRLEAQDHYLLVVTERGSDSLLMRLSDAEKELASAGLRVHRSHWVALSQVRQHKRDKGRDFLQMRDDTLVPVSRSYKPLVQAAGLL